MILFYFCNMLLFSFRFYKRDTLKGHIMRWIKVLILILLFLPACRTTRDTVVPQLSKTGSETHKQPYNEEIAMKFRDGEPAEEPLRMYEPEKPVVEEAPADETEYVEVELQEVEMESEATEWVIEYYMRTLTIEQKIGQRFIAHIKGTKLTKQTVKLIRDEYIAGVILYPWNVEDPAQVKKLTTSIQQTAHKNDPTVRLFICVDQEGGRVNTFNFSELSHFPQPYYWAQYDDPQFIE